MILLIIKKKGSNKTLKKRGVTMLLLDACYKAVQF